MIKNSLKIAIRILWKNKLFSLVNILSLSLSMAVGVILFTGIKATYRYRPFSSPTKSNSADTHAGNKGGGTNQMGNSSLAIGDSNGKRLLC